LAAYDNKKPRQVYARILPEQNDYAQTQDKSGSRFAIRYIKLRLVTAWIIDHLIRPIDHQQPKANSPASVDKLFLNHNVHEENENIKTKLLIFKAFPSINQLQQIVNRPQLKPSRSRLKRQYSLMSIFTDVDIH